MNNISFSNKVPYLSPLPDFTPLGSDNVFIITKQISVLVLTCNIASLD
jgi:hypothetical protein